MTQIPLNHEEELQEKIALLLMELDYNEGHEYLDLAERAADMAWRAKRAIREKDESFWRVRNKARYSSRLKRLKEKINASYQYLLK